MAKVDASGLKSFLSKLNTLKNIGNVTDKIAADIANRGGEIAREKYNSSSLSAEDMPNVFVSILGNGRAEVVAQGERIAYTEFGTGTIGQQSASQDLIDKKSEMGMNAYNSGKTIKRWKRLGGGLGWIKPTEAMTAEEQATASSHTDSKYAFLSRLTQGQPAGQQMYDTSKQLHLEAVEIAKVSIKELIDNAQ